MTIKLVLLTIALLALLLQPQSAMAQDIPEPDGECTYFDQTGTCRNWFTRVTEDTPGWAQTITEDDPAWNCATMGNMICDYYANPVYWPIRH